MTKLSFNNVKGQAQKSGVQSYDFKPTGDHKVRLFGSIIPRYVYWLKGSNNKSLPVQCLDFNRQTQKFDGAQKDWVKQMYPSMKCQWAYTMLCVHEGKVKAFNFKRKLFGQIMTLAQDLGDPTDLETGWDLYFQKKKTGPLDINVQYTVQQIKCSKGQGPVDEATRKLIQDSKPAQQVFSRNTPEQQKVFLQKLLTNSSETEQNIDDQSISAQFDIT